MRPTVLISLSILLVELCSPATRAQDDIEHDPPGERLATAIESGSVAAVRRLLDEGTSPNAVMYDSPAMMWAIWDDQYYVVKLLIDRGADVNLPDDEGYTPLMTACSMRNQRIAKLLIDNGAEINAVELTYGMSALQTACEAGDERIFDLLIEQGADVEHVDKYGGTCLEEAAFYGYGSIVDKLRGEGLTTDWPLHVACGLGNVDEVKKLLDAGAEAGEPNKGWQNTPLHFAAGGGHVDVARVLLERGATLDVKNALGAGPLHVCAGADTLEFVRWLVEQGAEINQRDSDGHTPLDWAGERVYKFLQQQGGEHGELEVEAEEP